MSTIISAGSRRPTLSAAPVSCPKAGALPWKKKSCSPKNLGRSSSKEVTFQLPGRPTQMTQLLTARKINKQQQYCWLLMSSEVPSSSWPWEILCGQDFFKTQVRVDEWWKSTMIHDDTGLFGFFPRQRALISRLTKRQWRQSQRKGRVMGCGCSTSCCACWNFFTSKTNAAISAWPTFWSKFILVFPFHCVKLSKSSYHFKSPHSWPNV